MPQCTIGFRLKKTISSFKGLGTYVISSDTLSAIKSIDIIGPHPVPLFHSFKIIINCKIVFFDVLKFLYIVLIKINERNFLSLIFQVVTLIFFTKRLLLTIKRTITPETTLFCKGLLAGDVVFIEVCTTILLAIK